MCKVLFVFCEIGVEVGMYVEVHAVNSSGELGVGAVVVADGRAFVPAEVQCLVHRVADRARAFDLALDGPSTIFSAPDHIIEQTRLWGREEFQRRFDESFDRFLTWADGWVELVRSTTPDHLAAHHDDLINGRTQPLIATLHRLS